MEGRALVSAVGSGTFGFAPAFFNLSETTRLLHIAEEIEKRGGEAVFFSHGGQFEHVVRERSLPIVSVEPQYSPEFVERALQVSRFETREALLTVDQIREHVRSEIEAYQARPLQALITGFNFTSSISARAARVPLVWFVQSPSTIEYYQQGLATFPDMFSTPVLSIVPRRLLDWLVNYLFIRVPFMMGPFNKVAREYRVPSFRTFLNLLRGDLTLVGDLPELTRLKPSASLPSDNFVGPILPAVKGEIDPAVVSYIETGRSSGRRPVFLAMGSSGQPELFASLIRALDGRRDLQTVVAYTRILTPDELPPVGEHVLLRRLVLAEEVARRVDLSIIHGGHGTVYTQAYSGTPFVGIPMQSEQQDNLEALADRGCGIWISYRRYREQHLHEAIDRIFDDYDRYKRSSRALRDSLPPALGAERAADLMINL